MVWAATGELQAWGQVRILEESSTILGCQAPSESQTLSKGDTKKSWEVVGKMSEEEGHGRLLVGIYATDPGGHQCTFASLHIQTGRSGHQ